MTTYILLLKDTDTGLSEELPTESEETGHMLAEYWRGMGFTAKLYSEES